MELVKRYVNTVRFFLPAERKEDIGRELEANLQEHIADREAELGRAMTAEEQAQLVQAFGHPYLAAMRYRPQRHLIGPLVWPAYWLAVKVALGITFLVYAFGVGSRVAAGEPAGEVARALGGYFHGALPAFGWVTFFFAMAELVVQKCKLEEKWGQQWDVQATLKAAKPEKTPKPFEAVLEIALALVFGCWFIASFDNPRLAFGLVPGQFTYGPVWYQYFAEWVALITLGVGLDLWKLLQPSLRAWIRRAQLLRDAGGLMLMYITVKSGDVIVAMSADPDPATERIANSLNLCVMAGMGIGLVVGVVALAVKVGKEGRDYARATSTEA